MKKLLISLCFLLIFASSLPSMSFARSVEVASNGEITIEKKDGRIFDKNDGAEIVSVIITEEDGSKTKISPEDFFEMIKQEEAIENESRTMSENLDGDSELDCIACVGGARYEYNETSASDIRGTVTNASDPSANCTLDNQSKSIGYRATKSHTINISLTSPEWKAFEAGVSYGFTSSATQTGTDQISIRPGHKGWFDFSANLRRSSGYLKTYWDGKEQSSEYVTSTYPKTSGGELSGVTIGKTAKMTSSEKKFYCEN